MDSHRHVYFQVKSKLWGVFLAEIARKDYLIEVVVVIEIDYLPLPKMITNCSIPNIIILR